MTNQMIQKKLPHVGNEAVNKELQTCFFLGTLMVYFMFHVLDELILEFADLMPNIVLMNKKKEPTAIALGGLHEIRNLIPIKSLLFR